VSDKPVIIMGTGGHAKVITDMLKLSGREVLGFVTPDLKVDTEFCDKNVLGNDAVINKYSSAEIELANGVGSLPRKNLRWELAEKMRQQGYKFATIIHPDAVIASDVSLGEGVQVMAGVVIQSGTQVGQDSIINTGALIDHDCKIAENCHLAPGVVLSGGVVVGKYSHIGTGVKITHYITINKNCIIAAGTTVHNDVPSNMLTKHRLKTIMDKVDNHA